MSMEVTVRILRPDDLDAIVAIDEKITGTSRPEYYQNKIALAELHDAQINASLVAEAGGKVIGFLMGTLVFGEFGIPDASAVIDTLGVDPDCQDRGAGGLLFDQFTTNMRVAQVERIYTMVDWKDVNLMKFFSNMNLVPSQRLSLELKLN